MQYYGIFYNYAVLQYKSESCSTVRISPLMMSRDTKAVICYPSGWLHTIYHSSIFQKAGSYYLMYIVYIADAILLVLPGVPHIAYTPHTHHLGRKYIKLIYPCWLYLHWPSLSPSTGLSPVCLYCLPAADASRVSRQTQ